MRNKRLNRTQAPSVPRPMSPSTSNITAAVYLRVSTDRQTADNQRPETEALAAARGFEIVARYEE